MSHWSQYDEDEHRLPEGMRRAGYDADTQRYIYRDTNGRYWQGPEGARYGNLEPVPHGYTLPAEPSAEEVDAQIAEDKRQSWRIFAPFLLIVFSVPLLFFWFASPRDSAETAGAGLQSSDTTSCSLGQRVYRIGDGDTCWAIAQDSGMSVEQLAKANPGIDCDALSIGATICINIVD